MKKVITTATYETPTLDYGEYRQAEDEFDRVVSRYFHSSGDSRRGSRYERTLAGRYPCKVHKLVNGDYILQILQDSENTYGGKLIEIKLGNIFDFIENGHGGQNGDIYDVNRTYQKWDNSINKAFKYR